MRLYLAGQITGKTFAEATAWRHYVRALCPPCVETVNPLRAKEFLEDMGPILHTPYEHVYATAKGVTTRDHYDLRTSDVVLMNVLGMQAPSLGCSIELGWADAYRIPVIMVAEEGNIHREHLLAQHIVAYNVDSLEEGVEVACAVLGDRVLNDYMEWTVERALDA